MMCLGWYNRPNCSARQQVDLTPNPATAPAEFGSGTCNVNWFWLSAAAILGVGLFKK